MHSYTWRIWCLRCWYLFGRHTFPSTHTHTHTHTHTDTHTAGPTAPRLWSVMSGVLLLLLTQGLFGWVFTASPRPSATAVWQESAGEERPLCFPRQALLHTSTLSETHAHTQIWVTRSFLLERQTLTRPSLFQLSTHIHYGTHRFCTNAVIMPRSGAVITYAYK